VLDTELGDMFMICLHIKFHISNPSGLVVIAVKPKAMYGFCMVTMLLNILQKDFLNESCIFFSDTKFQSCIVVC